MRPVKKWSVGDTFVNQKNDNETVLERYSPYTKAISILHLNLDCYCSYCEVFSSDLEVEHVVSQDQEDAKKAVWDNFLLACGRCNGKDNKSNKPVDINNIYLPHLNNTLLAFEYKEGGFIAINPQLQGDQINKAEKLMDLVGLDKYPGNPKYPETDKHPKGFPEGDKRWEHRRAAWKKAKSKLRAYENGEISVDKIVEFAKERGFFSVWYSVFDAHSEVRAAMIASFDGTDQNCFDPTTFAPIYRNPTNPIDPM
jgi:hypothetical protein